MSPELTAQDVARQSGSNFYLSFFSLPREKREAITAVYAFCREADDAVDAPGSADPRSLIARWRDEIARIYAGEPTRPLSRSLAQAIERFDLSREYFDGILTGVEMDLTVRRYPTFQALSEYAYHVAGEVGLLCMEIFGYRSERLKAYAVKLGMAFQLTNILRDVKTDAARDRIYLPQEDLQRFGVTEEWILKCSTSSSPAGGSRNNHGRPTEALGRDGFRDLMQFEAERTREFYRQARSLPEPSEKPDLRAAEIMRAVYEDLLDRIEQSGFDVFSDRIRVPRPRKLWLAAKAWWNYR